MHSLVCASLGAVGVVWYPPILARVIRAGLWICAVLMLT